MQRVVWTWTNFPIRNQQGTTIFKSEIHKEQQFSNRRFAMFFLGELQKPLCDIHTDRQTDKWFVEDPPLSLRARPSPVVEGNISHWAGLIEFGRLSLIATLCTLCSCGNWLWISRTISSCSSDVLIFPIELDWLNLVGWVWLLPYTLCALVEIDCELVE